MRDAEWQGRVSVQRGEEFQGTLADLRVCNRLDKLPVLNLEQISLIYIAEVT